MPNKDYRYIKQRAIEKKMGWGDYEVELLRMYSANMSAQEIADIINKDSASPLITPRSIQRRLKKLGTIRSVGDAYRIAANKGRIQWSFKLNKVRRKPINARIRFQVLHRDNYKCLLCGATAETSVLEVDHIIPINKGQDDSIENLRTLCHECNRGRHLAGL